MKDPMTFNQRIREKTLELLNKDIIPVGFADWKCSKCGVES